LKLITIKEYAKIEDISTQAVHKRVDKKLIKSCQLDELTYIIIKDEQPQKIKDLQQKIKLLNSNIKTLRLESKTVERQNNYVDKLENRVEHLENKIEIEKERLENKIDILMKNLHNSTEKKEELYEKVINTVMIGK
jgi:TolA-binding protein